jgi:hypothetical protein
MGYHTPFDDTARVVYRGQDDHVHELYYLTASGWGYADLSALTRAPAVSGNPHGYLNPNDGIARVVHRGADSHIHELAYSTGNGWAHADLAQLTGTTPAAGDPCGYVTPFDSVARVVYRSADGHVHELFYSPPVGWGHADLI